MSPELVATTPELMSAIHRVLVDLRRDLAQSNEIQKHTLSVLRDIRSELEFIKGEHRRLDRLESAIAELQELDQRNERIERLIDEVADATKPPEGTTP